MCRYANYKYNGKYLNNLGDHIQILAIDNLYANMGINKDELVYINMEDLATYNGARVKLPVAFPLLRYNENGIAGMFSDKIEPVFIALTIAKWFLEKEEVTYLKRYEPIGCRDEHTYQLLCKYEIDAYLNGCLTITLPQRQITPNQNKIYCIDIPEKLKDKLPTNVRENAIFLSNIVDGPLDNATKFASHRYQEYQDNASLIITSLLHISSPCTAYGIPIILARDLISYRFSWLDKLLPIYSENDYDTIDWNPKSIDVEKIRKIVTELYVRRMEGNDFFALKGQVSEYYLDRKKSEYFNEHFIKIRAYIDEKFLDKNESIEYSIWGITQVAEMIKKYMDENYCNSKLANVYDKITGKSFKGVLAKNILEAKNDEVIFVTSEGAIKQANILGKDKYNFVYAY